LRAGRRGHAASNYNLGDLLITSNAWLALSNLSGTTLTLARATIEAGGGILGTARGTQAAATSAQV